MIRSKIAGTGSYLPKRILTNQELAQSVSTSDEWIRERTGIRQRHIVAEDQTTCDMAEQAALAALEMSQWSAKDLDLIVVGTTTPDRVYPSTACRLQARLGSAQIPAFDVQAVCSGFLYAIGIADKFVRSGDVRRALVVGADTHSRLLDWSDRSTCILFGDGAGAVTLESTDKADDGVLAIKLHADGRYESLLYVEGGRPQGGGTFTAGSAYTKMNGNEVFKVAVRMLSQIAGDILTANGFSCADLDWLVPHQANIRIIEATARRLKLPMDRVVVTVDKHGNTSAASVPIALDTAVRDNRIQRGQLLLMEAFGGGFAWGAALLRY